MVSHKNVSTTVHRSRGNRADARRPSVHDNFHRPLGTGFVAELALGIYLGTNLRSNTVGGSRSKPVLPSGTLNGNRACVYAFEVLAWRQKFFVKGGTKIDRMILSRFKKAFYSVPVPGIARSGWLLRSDTTLGKGRRRGCFFISLLFLHHFISLLSVEGLKIWNRSRN